MQQNPNSSNRGISLLVVMSALLILSTLVISTTSQLIGPAFTAANVSRSASDGLSYRSALAVLQPILRSEVIRYNETGGNVFSGGKITVSLNETEQQFTAQDIYGLIDINAASSSLMTLFLTNIGLADRAAGIIEYRQIRPFNSVAGFWDIVSTNPEIRRQYDRLLTVKSGQRRINGQTAPLQLLQILAGQAGARENMLDNIKQRFLRVKSISLVLVSGVEPR